MSAPPVESIRTKHFIGGLRSFFIFIYLSALRIIFIRAQLLLSALHLHPSFITPCLSCPQGNAADCCPFSGSPSRPLDNSSIHPFFLFVNPLFSFLCFAAFQHTVFVQCAVFGIRNQAALSSVRLVFRSVGCKAQPQPHPLRVRKRSLQKGCSDMQRKEGKIMFTHKPRRIGSIIYMIRSRRDARAAGIWARDGDISQQPTQLSSPYPRSRKLETITRRIKTTNAILQAIANFTVAESAYLRNFVFVVLSHYREASLRRSKAFRVSDSPPIDTPLESHYERS